MLLAVELAIVILFSLICSVCDIRTKAIPVWLLIAGLAVTAGFKLIFIRPFDLWWLITAAGCGLFYFMVRLLTRGKLGVADIFFGVFQGMLLALPYLLLCILIECGCSALVFFILHKKRGGQAIPFIPFMAVGLLISFVISIC